MDVVARSGSLTLSVGGFDVSLKSNDVDSGSPRLFNGITAQIILASEQAIGFAD